MNAAPIGRLTLGRKFGLLSAATAVLAVSLATGLAVRRAEDLARESLRRRAYTLAATIGRGDSPFRPNIESSKSDCSVFVGKPVLGPPR